MWAYQAEHSSFANEMKLMLFFAHSVDLYQLL